MTIPAGLASAEIALTPVADPARRRTRDRPEPATVAILPGDGYDLGSPTLATAFIYEHTQGLVVSAPLARAIQNPPTPAQVVITRTGADAAALGSPLEIYVNASGSANPRTDYGVNLRTFPPNATIAAGAQSVTLTVTALPGANLPAAGKTLDFFVEDYDGGQPYHFDSLQRATVTLLPAPPPPTHPAFFNGEVALTNGIYYLAFANGNPFGYYSYLSDPGYLYHQGLGYEYVFDANDGKNGVYFYDFKTQGYFYTSPSFPFPYLYDFALNSTVYYYPDPSTPGFYNTNGVRYFYVFSTGQIISK